MFHCVNFFSFYYIFDDDKVSVKNKQFIFFLLDLTQFSAYFGALELNFMFTYAKLNGE